MKKEDAEKMSVQEMMDYAVKKIVEQGQRCIGESGYCVYGQSGKHCAIGWLLDETNNDLMSFGDGVRHMIDKFASVIPSQITWSEEVFCELQGFHDVVLMEDRQKSLHLLKKNGVDVSGQHWQRWVDMGS